MAHVRIMEPWEVGTPTQIPQRPGFGRQREGGVWTRSLPRYTSDDYLLARVQQDSNDRSALTASAWLASDHVRLFLPGEIGETPILAPKKSTDSDTTIDALGYTIDSQRMRISTTQAKVEAFRELLERDWPCDREEAKAQEVLNLAEKLWTSRSW